MEKYQLWHSAGRKAMNERVDNVQTLTEVHLVCVMYQGTEKGYKVDGVQGFEKERAGKERYKDCVNSII